MKAVFVLLGLAVVAAIELQPDSECSLGHIHPITPPIQVYLLSYITRRSPPFLIGISFFKDLDGHYLTRDAISLNNTHITYYKVRDGKSTHQTQRLQPYIPEGWNTLRLTVIGRTVYVAFVWNDDALLPVTTLSLDHDILEFYFEQAVALCSALPATAAWEMKSGQPVSVPLQLGGMQWLEVTAGASGTPYFQLPGETEKHSLPPNTTIEISNSLPWKKLNTTVSQNGKELARNTIPDDGAAKTLIIGGASQVRLMLSPPATANLPSATTTSNDTSGHTTAIAIVVMVVLVLLAAVGVWIVPSMAMH